MALYLFQNPSNKILKWDGASLTEVGSAPVTDAMFTANGTSTVVIPSDKASLFTGLKLLAKNTVNSASAKFSGVNAARLIIPKSDIKVSPSTMNIDSFNLTGTATNGDLRVIFSTDSGTTWKSYSDGSLVTVDTTNKADIKAKGLTPANLALVPSSIWLSEILDSRALKIRFAYYLEATTNAAIVETDLLNMQVDISGEWKSGVLNTDYTAVYYSANIMRVKLIANGDYRITIL